MSDQGWYDDSSYGAALQQAARATRWGWAAIAGVTGLLAAVAVALVVFLLVVAVVLGYTAVSVW